MAVPGSRVALGAVDGFLLDKLTKKWRPHFFVENKLRGFLDLTASADCSLGHPLVASVMS
jgi:hypothetical protein